VRWILVDVVLALLSVGLLALVGLSLWRRVKRLGREVSRAGELVAQATAQLEQAQSAAPAYGRSGATTPRPGVPSHSSS